MTCPYCGAEMKSGYLQSNHGIAWAETVLEDLILSSPVREKGAFFASGGEKYYKHLVPADYCAECSIFVARPYTPQKKIHRIIG